MPKKNDYASSMLAELAKYSPANLHNPTKAEIDAAVATLGPKPKPSITRGLLLSNPPKGQLTNQGSIRATPKGTLTQRAADWAAEQFGGTRRAHEVADKFAGASEFANPVSWATTLGDTAAKFAAKPSVSGGIETALGAANFLPVGKAAGALAHVALPALRRGEAKVLGKVAQAAEEDMVPFRHYSFDPNLQTADPSKWGSNPNRAFIPREERARMGVAPGRTYIGLDDGPKPYGREMGVGPHEYHGKIERSKLYDMAGDPDGLKAKGREIPKNQSGQYVYNDQPMDGVSLYENLIKDAGYKGYWIDNHQIGRAGALFEPHPLQYKANHAPLEGLPPKKNGDKATGPLASARAVANDYAKTSGIEYTPPTKYAPVDEGRARRIADAYHYMAHDPNHPEVKSAYDALTKETLAQYEAMKRAGVKLDFHPESGDPYGNPWNAIKDVRENNKLHVYPTDAGYGEGGITDKMVADNPMLQLVPGEEWSGKPVRVNDVFRGVHDYFGHAKEGVGFRADGEENAYRAHAAMFSPEARRALATETRGQNSWLNYGPHGEANRTAQLEGTKFADQKIGLLPDWAVYEGNEDFLKPPKPSPFVEHAEDAQGNKTITYTAKDGTKVPIKMGIDPDGTAEIAVDQFGTGKNKLGPAEIRDAMHGLMEKYPEIKTFGGFRRSGAGAGRVQEVTPRRPGALSQAPEVTPEGVLAEAARKKGAGETFAAWRAKNDAGDGSLFDYSNLDQVPDVPQTPMPRTIPPRGPSARITGALADPRVEEGINSYVQRGAELGGKDWYNTEPFRQEYIKRLGPDEGQKAYSEFMDAVAATSPRSTVQDNIRTASYYNYRRQNGLPVNEKPEPGYGSIAQSLHGGNMEKLVNGDGWDIYANPKPASFSTNLQGNQANATIDTHNFRLPGILSQDPRFLETSVQELHPKGPESARGLLSSQYPGLPKDVVDGAVQQKGNKTVITYRPQQWVNDGHIPMSDAVNDPALWTAKPNSNEYGHYEDWQREQATKMGMSPAQYQASMWVGAGDATGLASPPEPFLRTLESRVKYTAHRMKTTPDKVMDALVRGKAPLLSVGGAVGATGVLASQQKQPQYSPSGF